MNAFGRIPYLAAMFFIPGLSVAVVAGSIYMQGLASPFAGIFLGIAGLFFGLKVIAWILCRIDDINLVVRQRWPEVLRAIRFKPQVKLRHATMGGMAQA